MALRIVLGGSKVKLKKMTSHLNTAGYHSLTIAEEEQELLRSASSYQPDVLIIDTSLKANNLVQLGKVLQDKGIPVLYLIPSGKREVFEQASKKYFVPYLLYPCDDSGLITAINMVVISFREIIRLEEKIEDLQEKLDTRKVVDKAKGILMESFGMNEKEAFRHIQKQSMNKRLSMKKIAEAVILAKELGV